MAIDNDELLDWSRIAANRRVQVTNELFPGGLEELNDYTAEEVKDAVKNFRSHPTANQRFSLSANSTKKLVQLTLWVKDRIRLGQDVEFADGTTQAEFISTIDESQQREKIRQERKKNAEGLATMKIDPPLKASSGWDGWKDSVQTALMLAYGSKGVPLLYVIRTIPASTFPVVPAGGDVPSWEEVAIGAAPLAGLDYDADRKTVHLFLSNNISEDSDAHAYIHPLVARNDGRLDWQALCERYENEATIQARVNQANKTWEMLVYKNERAMSFEAFSKKLTKALQYFEAARRPKHDGDVIDWIWRHVNCSELSQHMSALKVGQSIHLRTSKQILQEIAKEVPNLSKASNFEPRISEIQQTSSEPGGFTFDGSTPSSGALTSDGKLYCGTYSPSRWFSDDVKPFHEQIREHRNEHRSKQSNKSSKSRDANRKLQELKTQNAELKRNLSALKSGGRDDDTAATEESHDNAGDAFGGKESMKKKSKDSK
jgi:hypothetical protein